MDTKKIEYFYNIYKNIFFEGSKSSQDINLEIKKNDIDFYNDYIKVKVFKYKQIVLFNNENQLYFSPLNKFVINDNYEYLCFNLSRDLILYKEILIEDNNNYLNMIQ